MKIVYQHSHLNGLEYLQVHYPKYLKEIQKVIENIDASKAKTKQSKEKNRLGVYLYSPKDLNTMFRDEFRKINWDEHRQTYFATPDEQLARSIMSLPPDIQKKEILNANKTP